MLSRRKIMITGHAGFIGSHLLKFLEEDYDIVPYDLLEGDDILDRDNLAKKMKGCDFVVHLGAFASIIDSWKNPSYCYDNNVTGTSNVVEEAIKQNVKRIIFASSCAVRQPVENPYAASKAMCEGILQVRQKEIPSIAFRFLNVYGKNQNPSYGNVMPNFINGIQKGKITVFGDGNQRRDFIHVSDICRAIKIAIEAEYNPKFPRYACMDLGTGLTVSVNELAYILMGMMGKIAKIENGPPRRELRTACADTKMMTELFKFEPKVNLVSGLRRLLDENRD